MELTIDQALQQGVEAHREGKLQDAERLYRAILQAQPKHPDANHNLGVLAVAVGKPLEAIPLFKLSLETNPQIEQFRLSYIDALIKLERFDEARHFLAEGAKAGVSSDRLVAIKKRLKGGSSDAEPSQDQLNQLLGHYQAGKLDEAEALASALTQQFPEHSFGWKVLGVVFRQTGRLKESLLLLQQSVDLSPQDAEAHSNLGITLRELGRFDEAEASYSKAIVLKPDYAEAHSNLGNTLQKLGRLDEAEASYREAIALKPDYAEAFSNLGNTLHKLGGFDEAEASYRKAIALKPEYAEAYNNLSVTLQELGRLDESVSACVRAINLKADSENAYFNLGVTLKRARLNTGDRSLYPILIHLLNKGNFVRPRDVAAPILSLLRLDNLIEDELLHTTAFTNIKEVDRAINTLAQVPLLHQLMRMSPLPDLQFEALIVSMRRVLLADIGQIEASPKFIHFLSTLSLHCFTNEYVYYEVAEETEFIGHLETAIAENIRQGSQPTITEILILAAYRPLHQYEWSETLRALDQSPEVKVRLLEEPLAERVIAQNMPVLSSVEDEVSRKVKQQYEANPYPRWVKLAMPSKGQSIAEVCNEAKLLLHSENIKSVLSPSILIAGCGTGQHSIGTASRFANCQVTAIDLSLASLAYAQRKTRELSITNIEYMQADILNLGELRREFDIIESTGVLHHMDDPMAGWQVLVDLLKTGGLMKIGLYSDSARRPVVKTREDVALREVGSSEAEIRQFRQSLIESHDEHHLQLAGFGDFFSLSEVRDLIFHVQEQRFTLPQVQKCLEELHLKFCGFEVGNNISGFKKFIGKDADIFDLSLWHQFEETHPSAFAGMYQFWCQKL